MEGETKTDTADVSAMGTRKRVRSGDLDSEVSEDIRDTSPVAKKMSVSDVEASKSSVDRVALLDAGAQYGKVGIMGRWVIWAIKRVIWAIKRVIWAIKRVIWAIKRVIWAIKRVIWAIKRVIWAIKRVIWAIKRVIWAIKRVIWAMAWYGKIGICFSHRPWVGYRRIYGGIKECVPYAGHRQKSEGAEGGMSLVPT